MLFLWYCTFKINIYGSFTESSTSISADGSSSSAESKPSDLETSAVGASSSEESEIDLLAELQAAAVLEG